VPLASELLLVLLIENAKLTDNDRMLLQMKSTLWDVTSSSIGPDLVSDLALVSFIGYMLYNEGSLHNNIRGGGGKQSRHYCYQRLFYFSVDATCFGPYIGPSSGVQWY
jgi:hypothetical protein